MLWGQKQFFTDFFLFNFLKKQNYLAFFIFTRENWLQFLSQTHAIYTTQVMSSRISHCQVSLTHFISSSETRIDVCFFFHLKSKRRWKTYSVSRLTTVSVHEFIIYIWKTNSSSHYVPTKKQTQSKEKREQNSFDNFMLAESVVNKHSLDEQSTCRPNFIE